MANKYDFIKVGVKVRWNDPGINDYDPEDREEQLNIEWTVCEVRSDNEKRLHQMMTLF